MQSKKEENLFKKLVKKDYKNDLETVLEKKYFGENAKSLLLEILYKIEAAYKDYEVVKKDAKTKDEYIENYIKIIEKKCKTIKIVKPNSEQSKLLGNRTFIINKKRNEITCLPIARKLLYAVSKLDKKDKIVNNKYFLLSDTLSNLINVGDCINTVEPLREFNGWSWTTVPREIESIEYNLIYQIILILAGRKLLEDWIRSGDTIIDYVEELDNKLIEQYGPKLAKEMIFTLNKLSILMEIKFNPDIEEQIEKSKNDIQSLLEKFNDKQEYIQELTDKKNALKKEILQIDTKISDNDLLQNEYVKRNDELPLEEKIFSMRVLANMMIEEREELYKEMEEYNSLLKPLNFLNRKEELKKEYDILKLADTENQEAELQDKMKKLQELFLECFKIKIEKAETKQNIISLIYQFRYYCLLPYSLNENIYNVLDIQKKLNQTGKILVKKANNTKTIVEFAQNETINYEIVKKIFQVRIVNLEDLSMKIVKEKDDFFVQFFDEKTFDQKLKLNVPGLNKKELNVRINKKVKLFE